MIIVPLLYFLRIPTAKSQAESLEASFIRPDVERGVKESRPLGPFFHNLYKKENHHEHYS